MLWLPLVCVVGFGVCGGACACVCVGGGGQEYVVIVVF